MTVKRAFLEDQIYRAIAESIQARDLFNANGLNAESNSFNVQL
jgi:hypothetical protein